MDKDCFVICALDDEGSSIRRHADLTYEFIISPVVKDMGFVPSRADYISDTGTVTNQIINKLIKSDLVIADLSFRNPNVYYELAIRHFVGKPLIQMISPLNEPIPFDISGLRTIKYSTELDKAEIAKNDLKGKIQCILTDFKPDNPIRSAINDDVIQEALSQLQVSGATGDAISIIKEAVIQMNNSINDVRSELLTLKESIRSQERPFQPNVTSYSPGSIFSSNIGGYGGVISQNGPYPMESITLTGKDLSIGGLTIDSDSPIKYIKINDKFSLSSNVKNIENEKKKE